MIKPGKELRQAMKAVDELPVLTPEYFREACISAANQMLSSLDDRAGREARINRFLDQHIKSQS